MCGSECQERSIVLMADEYVFVVVLVVVLVVVVVRTIVVGSR